MRSFGNITTTPNELCARLLNRLPVILKPEAAGLACRGGGGGTASVARFLSHRRSFADAEARCT
jgi:hypothetical protein